MANRVPDVIAVTLTLISLSLRMVIGCGALVAVTVALKVSAEGDRVSGAGVALPISATLVGVKAPLGRVVGVSEPLKPLPTLTDENVRRSVQLWEFVSVNGGVAQLPPATTAKRGVIGRLCTVNAAPLLLLSVSVCGALVAVTVALKVNVAGDSVAPLPRMLSRFAAVGACAMAAVIAPKNPKPRTSARISKVLAASLAL